MASYLKQLVIVIFFCLSVAGLPADAQQNSSLSYLALGDSYTIGEKVSVDQRWPVQLVDSLRSEGVAVQNPKIIAQTGWTTDELIAAVDDADLSQKYDLVSLLIGVNNQYRGYDFEIFRKEFDQLLEQAIAFAGGESQNVFVVSIPDYGVTPLGQQKNPDKIARQLKRYNAAARKISDAHDVSFVNITPESKEAKTDTSLVASDNLHPSGKMYQQWVDQIFPVVFKKLQ